MDATRERELEKCRKELMQELVAIQREGRLDVTFDRPGQRSKFEVLEFYGDAVLSFLVSRQLYQTKGMMTPHLLSRQREKMISNATLARVCDYLKLPDVLPYRVPEDVKVKGDIMECLIGELQSFLDLPGSQTEERRSVQSLLKSVIAMICWFGEQVYFKEMFVPASRNQGRQRARSQNRSRSSRGRKRSRNRGAQSTSRSASEDDSELSSSPPDEDGFMYGLKVGLLQYLQKDVRRAEKKRRRSSRSQQEGVEQTTEPVRPGPGPVVPLPVIGGQPPPPPAAAAASAGGARSRARRGRRPAPVTQQATRAADVSTDEEDVILPRRKRDVRDVRDVRSQQRRLPTSSSNSPPNDRGSRPTPAVRIPLDGVFDDLDGAPDGARQVGAGARAAMAGRGRWRAGRERRGTGGVPQPAVPSKRGPRSTRSNGGAGAVDGLYLM